MSLISLGIVFLKETLWYLRSEIELSLISSAAGLLDSSGLLSPTVIQCPAQHSSCHVASG